MNELASYLTDDRDLPEDQQLRLVILQGGNGDWYVQVAPKHGVAVNGVRVCTSGGASSSCPGLVEAVADAFRAMLAAQRGERGERPPSRAQLEEEVRAWRDHFPEHRYEFLRIVKTSI